MTPLIETATIALVALLIGLSKGGMGAVLVVLATPLLSQVMPVTDAISLTLPLLLIADAFALWMYRRTWDMHYIRLMLPAAVVGVIIGTALLASLPDLALRRILGIFTLAFVVYKVWIEARIGAAYTPKPWHGVLAGGASGLASALANNGAPPFTAYMLLQNLTPRAFVGTTTLFFAIVNAIKLPGLIAANLFNFENLTAAWWALPTIPLGVWAGRWIVNRIDKLAFERFILSQCSKVD
jgi:uncharacterized membrane protein YfcA